MIETASLIDSNSERPNPPLAVQTLDEFDEFFRSCPGMTFVFLAPGEVNTFIPTSSRRPRQFTAYHEGPTSSQRLNMSRRYRLRTPSVAKSLCRKSKLAWRKWTAGVSSTV